MRKLVGVLVLLAGLGLAANVFRSSQDRIASLDQVLKSSNDSRSGSVARSQSARSAVGTVSPERRSAASPEPAASAAPAPTRWQRQEVVVNYDAAAGTSRDADGPAAPAPARDRLAVQNSAGQSSVAPGDAEARYQLARTLQAELRRVGCYEGDVDGSWGLGSKRAMAAFAKEVNAGLPTEEPDYILLKLVQARKGQVCGKPCPAGQAMAENGRCASASVLASRGTSVSKVRISEPVPSRVDSPAPGSGALANDVAPQVPTTTAGVGGGERSSDEALAGRMAVGAPIGEEQKTPPAASEGQPGPSPSYRSERRARGGVGILSSDGAPAKGYAPAQSKRWTQTIFKQLSMH